MSTHAITRGTPPTLNARKPTGKPTWPMLLLAGGQKCGKTYTAVELSASDLVDRMFVIEVGEGAVDQYGAIPGARFEILDHDGTFQGIARQVWAATLVPRGPSGKPHAIVLDSATEVWDLVTGEQQELANVRRDRKNAASNRPTADGADDATITMDQWNAAKKRWRALVDLLRSHDGPVIWTARFEEVAKVEGGRPVEGQKDWKIRTEKNLPYEVDGVIEIPAPREFFVTGIRSLRFVLDPGEKRKVPGFSLDAMLRALGLEDPSEIGARNYTAPDTGAYIIEHDAEQAARREAAQQPGQQQAQRPTAPRRTAGQWVEAIAECPSYEAARALYRECQAAGQLEVDFEGLSIGDRIRGRGEVLRDQEAKAAADVMRGGSSAAPATPATPPAPPSPEAPAEAPGAAEPVANPVTGGGSEAGETMAGAVGPDNPADALPPPAPEGQPEELAEPDPIQSRRESARRKGTIAALLEQFGNAEVLDAAAVQELRQTVENVSTQRLSDWLQATIRGAREFAGAGA